MGFLTGYLVGRHIVKKARRQQARQDWHDDWDAWQANAQEEQLWCTSCGYHADDHYEGEWCP
jgi:hypothetical protein